MENASKALIIAGTLLVLLLLISAGMYVFNNAGNLSGSMKKHLTQEEIDTFNNQFQKYEGQQSGARVKELITAVNRSNEKSDLDVTITSYVNQDETSGIYYPGNNLINGNTYNVTFTRDNSNIITVININ